MESATDDAHSAMLSELFTERTKKTSPAKPGGDTEIAGAGQSKLKATQLLDRRRAQNIEIMLRSLPREVSHDRLAEAICTAMPKVEPEPEPEPEPDLDLCETVQ